MKNKQISLFLLMSMMVGLSACGGKIDSNPSISNSGEITSEQDTSSVDVSTSSINLDDETEYIEWERYGIKLSDLTYVDEFALDDERMYTGYLLNGKPEKEGYLEWILTNCTYEGEFHNGMYHGYGVFNWKSNKDQFDGRFLKDEPYYGKFTYGNTMNYTGYMKDWKFHGQGVFDWNTYNRDGTVKTYGWLYEGEFVNGDITGCYGKTTFTDGRNGLGREGIYWFEGQMSGFPAIKPNQMGKGMIRYGDKSYYTGELWHSANDYLRKGHGEMLFVDSNLKQDAAWGVQNDELLYKFVGDFDYEVSGWIYGNGAMYYVDKDTKQPKRYCKGFFNACHIIGEYNAEEFLLEEGFEDEMESKYIRFRENYDVYMTDPKWEAKHHEFVFAGASYMTFMNTMQDTPFSKYFGNFDAVNVGCGGSTFADWLNYYDTLIKPYTPDKVVLALGGNDIANKASIEMMEKCAKDLIDLILKDFSSAKIYLVGNWKSPARSSNYKQEYAPINDVFKQLELDYEAVCYIPVVDLTVKDLQTYESIDNINDYFLSDGLHMNDAGYTLWANRVKEYLPTK